jgi:predicted nucleic acid-binding protein
MSQENIALNYVIDSDVAFYGSSDVSLFDTRLHGIASASVSFLARAAYHGAQLHVPSIFLSEVMQLVFENFVMTGAISLTDSKIVLNDILSPTWDIHFAVHEDVLEFQDKLRRSNTSEAEYLAVAFDVQCIFVTASRELLSDVQKLQIPVSIMHVTDHPWAQTGALEDFPPGS